jgi:hypothetical protein
MPGWGSELKAGETRVVQGVTCSYSRASLPLEPPRWEAQSFQDGEQQCLGATEHLNLPFVLKSAGVRQLPLR